jgi:hypothetical protein
VYVCCPRVCCHSGGSSLSAGGSISVFGLSGGGGRRLGLVSGGGSDVV